LQLTGISTDKRNTLGSSVIRIYGEDALFHLVEENFPIQSDGILGTEFLSSRSAKIDYALGCLNLKDISIPFSEGYIPRLQLPPGIYAGEALIRNDNGKGFFKISTTTSEDFMFEIPRLELFDFNMDTLPNSGSKTVKNISSIPDPNESNVLSFIHTIFADEDRKEISGGKVLKDEPSLQSSRSESVKALLRLDHLNLEESSQNIARQNLVGAKIRSKLYYDRTARGQNLTVGQDIYLLKQPTTKLGNQYSGPHQILEVLPNNNLKISYKNRTRIVHKDKNLVGAKIRSKLYYDRTARGQNLTVGQDIYLLKQPTTKLGNQYSGPHQILEVLPNNNLKISYKNRTRIVHKDKVKIAKRKGT
ncbi:hypothetical protein M0802_016235, partial [Mischocyttarus mexicanus]